MDVEAKASIAAAVGTPSLSVVIPVFRSAPSLPELARRLAATLSSMTDRWEVIFVDDASPDGSFEILQGLRAHDSRLKLIRLARNRGQHHATLCGLHHSSGDYVFTMDDDLQAPPEDLPKFLAKLREGYDVVIGRIAPSAKRHTWARNIASLCHQRIAERVLGKPKHLSLSSFRGLSRHAVDAVKGHRGAHPQIVALIFRSVHVSAITNVDFTHQTRLHGSSTYSFVSLVKLSSYLLINHSYLPLRIMVAWGMTVSVASMAFAAFVFFRAVFVGHVLPGWASLAILVSFLCGNVLFAIGVLGEYLGRVVEEFSSAAQFEIHRIEF
jgi:undecaprenyl-phosphate 4-deoxy-4-formamido-L-arabinose transferase